MGEDFLANESFLGRLVGGLLECGLQVFSLVEAQWRGDSVPLPGEGKSPTFPQLACDGSLFSLPLWTPLRDSHPGGEACEDAWNC